ncbi:hypothetical protein ACQPW1_10250 [Nocardia sp. CA-128927]|uniref:hypothetical protein n=1 Tax=Nocardia sp. CA-128927 TaxID=3239975 RepID=UPI003D98D9F7
MSYNDLRDFICEFERCREGLIVQVEKVGGGTVGKAYVGNWRYIVLRDGAEIARGQDYTGSRLTHAQAARHIADFFIGED